MEDPLSDGRLIRDLDEVLTRTEGAWDELRGGRIFITGGTGFFGCWLLESFLRANEKLHLNATAVVLTRDPVAFALKMPAVAAQQAITFWRGDVRSFDYPDGEFSHLIHAASQFTGGITESNALVVADTILEGTRRVLDFSRQHGVRKMLITSSGAVYGRQPSGVTHVPEDFSGAPDATDYRSAYGESKRAAELLCVLHARQQRMEVKIARCFAFAGPYLPLDEGYAIGNFIRDAMAGGPVRISGDGTPWRSYLYAGDLAVWLWTILFRGQSCRAYNVGSDKALTIEQVARTVAAVRGANVEVVVGRQPVTGVPAERYIPSIERARNELGLNVWTNLEQTIQRTLEFNECR